MTTSEDDFVCAIAVSAGEDTGATMEVFAEKRCAPRRREVRRPFQVEPTGEPPLKYGPVSMSYFRESGVSLDHSRLWFQVEDGGVLVYVGESYGDACGAFIRARKSHHLDSKGAVNDHA